MNELVNIIPYSSVILVGVGCIALGLVLLFTSRQLRARKGNRISAVVLGFLAGGTLLASLHILPGLAWEPIALLSVVWLTSWLFRTAVPGRLGQGMAQLASRPIAQALLLIGLSFSGILGWASLCERSIPVWTEKDEKGLPPARTGVAGYAYTDKGSQIELNTVSGDGDYEELANLEEEKYGKMLALIRVANPSPEYNCHGWVFAEGKYWISGEDVLRILDENGYQEVKTPQAGDVIAYLTGDIVQHSGVVRAVLPDGTVLIESKWAKMGRFLHAADKSIYSGDVHFYRSPRVGHTLRGLDEAPLQPAKNPTKKPVSLAAQPF